MMIFKGKDRLRWRKRFALLPIWVGGTNVVPVWCWLGFYEWRYVDDFSIWFERRRVGGTESIRTCYAPD